MSLRQDWDGVVELKTRLWEAQVEQRKLQAHLPRTRATWRRRAGAWLMAAGVRLTHLGAQMAECEADPRATVTG
jgi:hypothetical protein